MQILHYIWIGPPPGKMPGSVVAHDVIGAFYMEKRIDLHATKILFWCLDAFAPFYQDKFAGTNIVVCSVEKHLVSILTRESNILLKTFSQKILLLKNIILDRKDRGTIRDLVTFKEVMAYFLLFAEGGYVLDSNVLPDFSTKGVIHFPNYENFKMILFEDELAGSVDVWMMYSPKQTLYSATVFEIFINNVFLDEENLVKYPDLKVPFSNRVLKAAFLKDPSQKIDLKANQSVAFFTAKKGNICARVREIPVIKYFFNTHQNKGDWQLPMQVWMGDIAIVKFMIASGADINRKTTLTSANHIYENCTALDIAMYTKKLPMVLVLLSNGADRNSSLVVKTISDEVKYDFNTLLQNFSNEQQITILKAIVLTHSINILKAMELTKRNTIEHDWQDGCRMFSKKIEAHSAINNCKKPGIA